jgi:hypothetical protein
MVLYDIIDENSLIRGKTTDVRENSLNRGKTTDVRENTLIILLKPFDLLLHNTFKLIGIPIFRH